MEARGERGRWRGRDHISVSFKWMIQSSAGWE